ncbi:MAG TPA: hypothetical protein VKK19_06780 [Candidatus Dormibacteraeota bacterium]|nr:hypothetical protein [Candidatus Dormibacteraeota bacterium]
MAVSATTLLSAKFAGTTEDHLDPALVDEDLRRLRESARKVAAYVEKVIAHKAWEPRAPVAIPTFEELYVAIDSLAPCSSVTRCCSWRPTASL